MISMNPLQNRLSFSGFAVYQKTPTNGPDPNSKVIKSLQKKLKPIAEEKEFLLKNDGGGGYLYISFNRNPKEKDKKLTFAEKMENLQLEQTLSDKIEADLKKQGCPNIVIDRFGIEDQRKTYKEDEISILLDTIH